MNDAALTPMQLGILREPATILQDEAAGQILIDAGLLVLENDGMIPPTYYYCRTQQGDILLATLDAMPQLDDGLWTFMEKLGHGEPEMGQSWSDPSGAHGQRAMFVKPDGETTVLIVVSFPTDPHNAPPGDDQ